MADEAKGGYGAAMAGLVFLGLVAFGVFLYARCGLFVQSSSDARVERQAVASGLGDQQSAASIGAEMARECEGRFAERKSQVLGLHERGRLDAYGLSDIGALSGYGISEQAAGAVSDILADVLDVNGIYGLQNDYNGVADAVCAVVAQDEVLIREGAREALVNR